MLQTRQMARTELDTNTNWVTRKNPSVLKEIHHPNTNISIYDRDVAHLTIEADRLLEEDIRFQSTGNIPHVLNELSTLLKRLSCQRILEDITQQLQCFRKVTRSRQYRVLLAVVQSNMCKKFHTDINDLRLLCTYRGPGTEWLTEDNVNREALQDRENREDIVIDSSHVRQVDTGSVAILKGALYEHEDTRAVVHRSPAIEHSCEKRLLLRIDTEATINLWS